MTTVQSDRQSPIGLGSAMVHALAKNWWLLLLRGVAAIIFGVLAFAWPGLTLLTLILFYGAFALADGVLAIIAAITGGAPAPRWWLAIVGLLGIAAGLLTFLMPGVSALVLLFFIAGWAIATGVMQIIGAIQLRKEIDNEWLLILGGVISVLFGVAMMVAPGAGALALVWVIAIYSVITGVMLVALAFRLEEARPCLIGARDGPDSRHEEGNPIADGAMGSVQAQNPVFSALADRALANQEAAETADVADLNDAEAAFGAFVEGKPLDLSERNGLVRTAVDLPQYGAMNLRRLVGLARIDHDADRIRLRRIERKDFQDRADHLRQEQAGQPDQAARDGRAGDPLGRMVGIDHGQIVAVPHRRHQPQQVGRQDRIDSLQHAMAFPR